MSVIRKNRKIKKQGFMKGVVILVLSQILIKVLGLVYRMYMTNREGFGDRGNAIYASGFQVYALLLTISSIGVPNAVARLISERTAVGDNRGAYKIFKIAIITFGTIGFCCSIFLFLGANIIANNWLQIPEAEMSLVALSPSIFFVSVISVIRGYFTGRQSIKVTANSQSLEQVFKTLLTVIVVEIIAFVTGTDTSVMAAGANLATTLSAILCFGYLYLYYISVRKEIAREIKNSVNYKYMGIRKIIKKILSVSIPMSLSPVLATINKNIDSMTVVRGVKKFVEESEAKAQYGILSGKVDTLVALPMSFNIALITALVPAVSSARAKGNTEDAKRRIEFSLLITVLIGLPCTFGMIVFANPILKLLFPNQISGGFILQVSAISIIFIVLEQTISGILQGIGKSMIPVMALGIGVIVKMILNIILTSVNPNLFILGGTAGAAFATAVCHLVALLIDIYIMNKNIKLNISIKNYIVKPLIASVFMAITSLFIYTSLLCIISENLSTILSIMFAVIIYILLVFILKIFKEENFYMIPYGMKIYKVLEMLKIY